MDFKRVASLFLAVFAARLAEPATHAQELGQASVEAARSPATKAWVKDYLRADFSGTEPRLRAELVTADRLHREHYTAARHTEAIDAARAGLARATAAGRLSDQVPFLRHLAYDYWLVGATDAALGYAHRVVVAGETLGDAGLRSQGHRYLSLIHHALADPDRARAHALEAQRKADSASDPSLRIFAIEALAAADLLAGDFTAAERGFTEVRSFWLVHNFLWNAANSLFDLAGVAEARGALDYALVTHHDVLEDRIQFDDRRGQVRSHRAIAGILRRLGRTEEAAAQLAGAAALAGEIGGHSLRAEFYGEQALVQEALGHFAEALAAERLAAAARGELASERARVNATEISARLDLAQKERSIAQLERGRARLWAASSAIGAGLLIAGGLLFFRWRQERRLRVVDTAARLAAERADAFKSRFLAVASHDLKTPLASLNTAARLLEESAHDPAAVTELATALRSETGRMGALIRDFLDATALEAGRMELRNAIVEMGALVATAVAERQRVAAVKQQSLVFLPAGPPPPPVLGDPDRLRQAIDNLVGNALKFTPAGGRVEVRVRTRDRNCIIEVADNGPGLAPEDFASLFTPFTPLSARPTGGEPSTGLGLSIAREIVALHGGRVIAASVPGSGATFTIDLPPAHAS